MKKIGLAGVGRLGTALLSHNDQSIGIYHYKRKSAEEFSAKFHGCYPISLEGVSHLDYLILTLPPAQVNSVVQQIVNLKSAHPTTIINMATALSTDQLRQHYPQLHFIGVKYMGNAASLKERGNGLFIAEQPLPDELHEFYKQAGKVVRDDESIVQEVNEMATEVALKAAVDMKEQARKKGLHEHYVNAAFEIIAPEVLRAFHKGQLGGFAREILDKIKK